MPGHLLSNDSARPSFPANTGVNARRTTQPLHLLVVEDDPVVREACVQMARSMGFSTASADSISAGRAELPQPVDIVLLDIRLPGGNGIEFFDEIRARQPSTIVIIMTAYATVESAVEALRIGAGDYLAKPFTLETLASSLERAAERRIFDVEARALRERLRSGRGEGHLTGRSPAMEKLYRILSKVTFTTHPVLIVGESGTGKGVVAQTIHLNGPRAADPFNNVECSSLTPRAIESKLFGSCEERGLLAQPGTLFLDEVADLPLELQTRLLRALETRQVINGEGRNPDPVTARLLASTTRDLSQLVQNGRFRKDLFYRLNVVNLRLPPLRERKEDIPLLAASILQRAHGHNFGYTIAHDALHLLVDYNWPGNVRELQHALERALALSSGPVLHLGDLPTQLQNARAERDLSEPGPAPTSGLTVEVRSIAEMEKQAILATLRQLNGDKLMAARLLGIGKTTLYRKLKEYGLTDQDVCAFRH
ncbi:MAG TPA: sigma-54 dependent transcriptional regulator [Acidobacteriaceae bacterium]